jgi:dCTP deaminase
VFRPQHVKIDFDRGGRGPNPTSQDGVPARGVLEVRCHESPFVLEHGQTVGRLVYEHMAAPPSQLYGTDIASNYQGQGLKLSKHFKP